MDIFSSIEEETEQLNGSVDSGGSGHRKKDRNGSRTESKMTTSSKKKMMKDINNRNSGSEESITNEGNDEAEDEDELDDEMKCKLDSKSKALLILSQDLVTCQRERDEYKLMAEQIRDKYSRLKKVLLTTSTDQLIGQGLMGHPSTMPLTQVLLELTDQNKFLLFEVEELKAKLTDSESDLKMLREQLRNMRNIQRFESGDPDDRTMRTESSISNRVLVEEAVVEQLESFRNKVLLMERDLQLILEEKEELICSRDTYKRKVQRLNQQLNELLTIKNDATQNEAKSSILDIDSVVTENLFLKEKLKALEDEKRLNAATMTKYKAMLESNSKGGYNTSFLHSISRSLNPALQQYKISENEGQSSDVMCPSTQVISSKQIQSFINSHELNTLPINEQSIGRLRSLLLALFEAFCDKSSALVIHKKNNKLLGRRINELEDKIRELMAKEKVLLLTSRDMRLDQEIERHVRELDSRIELNSSLEDSRVSSSLAATSMTTPPITATETKYGNPDHDQDLEDIDRVIQSLRAEVERVGMDDEERWRVNRDSSLETDVDVTRMDIGSEMRATQEIIAKGIGSLSGASRTESSSSSEYSDPDAMDSRDRFINSDRRRVIMRRQTERIDDDELLPSDYTYAE